MVIPFHTINLYRRLFNILFKRSNTPYSFSHSNNKLYKADIMYMYGITFMSLSVTCDALIRELHLHHILTDTNTMHILNTLGFTTLASLRGIKKITLRKKGLSYGRANEIVNAVNHTQVNTLHMVVHKPMCPKKKRTHPPFRPKSSKIKPIRKLHSTHTSHVDKACLLYTSDAADE